MFQIGDVIVCGSDGVCRVEEIGPIDMGPSSKGRLYYTLSPVFDRAGKVFIPVDNEKVVTRFIISDIEAHALLDSIPDIEQLWVGDEKKREQEYKNAVNSCDCKRLVQIIKTLYSRKQDRIKNGKKVTAIDERYFRIAENRLYSELALALNIDIGSVEENIRGQIKDGKR